MHVGDVGDVSEACDAALARRGSQRPSPHERAARFAGIAVEDEAESVIGRFGAAAILTAGAAAGVSALLGNGLLVLPLVVGIFVLGVVHATRSVGLTIGADGIAYERFGQPPRFVPYAHVRELVAGSDGATILLESGERIALRCDAREGVESGALAARLRELLERHRTSRSRGSDEARDTLRQLGALSRDRGATYRRASVPDDILWSIVEDPTATSASRIEAATALHASLDEAGRLRVRVAADACASPKLRVALESLVDEDAIEAAARPRSHGA